MTDRSTGSAVAQFLVQGMGSDEDFDLRCELEELLDRVLTEADAGSGSGGDGGSGTMNVFLEISDASKAKPALVEALQAGGHDDVVVGFDAEGADEDADSEVWWPEDYPYAFTVFGPVWKGPLPEDDLVKLDPEVRRLQGMWSVERYDMPDGSSGEGVIDGLAFLIVRARVLVRRGPGVMSDADMDLHPEASPKGIDMHPRLGANVGLFSEGIYELTGDELQLCIGSPDDDRPEGFLPRESHQVGRMIMRRQS